MTQITFFSQLSEGQLQNRAIQASNSLENYYTSNDYFGSQILHTYEVESSFHDYSDRLAEEPSPCRYPSREYLKIRPNFSQEFTPELATFDRKIDRLEAKTAKLKGQIFADNSLLNCAPISLSREVEKNSVSNNNFCQQNECKNSVPSMKAENIGIQKKSNRSDCEILPVEVIQEQLIPPVNITFAQLAYSNAQLNIELFCMKSVENGVENSDSFQTNKTIAQRQKMTNSWGLPTNQEYHNHWEWNGLLNEEIIKDVEQEKNVQIVSLGVSLTVQGVANQDNPNQILVDIQLV